METITINSIFSKLSAGCTFKDDNNQLIEVPAGGRLNDVSNLNLEIVSEVNSIDESVYRAFQVEGDNRTKAFAVVEGTGLISALGTNQEDFAPNDPCQVKISIPEAMQGHSISLTLMEHFEDNERVVWVIGAIDDVI